ncbi:ATP synthase-coupling factor 6, mitochondrial [Drosophila subpulchrella]|uniref:ATP synthase-coupling factor 6, mitochondrial n=1 Tax=Drosophila subpulchrella TaxID=1486046 RepID=UPI0018A1B031|nr:ATP synthase-coupling factor 6, mitochondrial [Drosophila subpulchrella]
MFSRILKPSLVLRRSVTTSASLRYKDPIYHVFLDKVREYRLKSPTGKPIDPGPEYEAELKESLERLALQYGGGEGVDMLEFPKFKLPDIDIDPISVLELPENQPKPEKKDSETGDDKKKDQEVKAKDDKNAKTRDKDKKDKDDKKASETKGKDDKDKKK